MSAALPEAVRAAGTPIEAWFQDEARVGQQGTLTYIWAETGSRPCAPKGLRYEWAYLFGAVCAERGVGAALVLPHANTSAMTLHLAGISRSVAPGAHAVLVCDSAGWHKTGRRLRVPGNITLLRLPPYSPELNPVETIWEYLRANRLSNSVFDTYDTIVDRCCAARTWLTDTPDRIRSIAAAPWTKTARHYVAAAPTSKINSLENPFAKLLPPLLYRSRIIKICVSDHAGARHGRQTH